MDVSENPVSVGDVCRICRSEGTTGRPLCHPCTCKGSLKYVHQECLLRWLYHRRNALSCELCGYEFSFTSVYARDTPQRIPIKDIAASIVCSVLTGIKYWLLYTLIGLLWLYVVPFTTCRIYRSLFNGSVRAIISLPIDVWSLKKIADEIIQGYCVLAYITVVRFGIPVILEHGGGYITQEGDEPNSQQQQLIVMLPPLPEEGSDEEIDRQQLGNPTWIPFFGTNKYFEFIKHVFSVVSQIALCILLLMFVPYQIGNLTINQSFSLQAKDAASDFEGLVTTFCGYCLIGLVLLTMCTFATNVGLKRYVLRIKFSLIVTRVFLKLVIELAVLPLLCGWLLDICTLSLFDTNIRDRLTSFRLAPDTSTLTHWFVGHVVFEIFERYYYLSFVPLLREIVRPGLLWTAEETTAQGILQAYVHQRMPQYGIIIFRTIVIDCLAAGVIVWLPIETLKHVWPTIFSSKVTLHSDSATVLFGKFVVLQVWLYSLFRKTHTRHWFKTGLRVWCATVSRLLGIQSYLLGDGEELVPVQVTPARPSAADLGSADGEQSARSRPLDFRPYTRPACFAPRVVALFVLAASTLAVISFSVVTAPLWLGHPAWSFVTALAPAIAIFQQSPSPNVRELCAAACGACVCWLSVRAVCVVGRSLPEKRASVVDRLRLCLEVGSGATVACVVLLGVVPFLTGRLLELATVVPFQVPFRQTPVLRPWKDWISGVVYTKAACDLILMGPADWPLRRVLERTYRNGFVRLDLKSLMRDLAVPVIAVLSLALVVPYVVACSVVPWIVNDESVKLLIARLLYPSSVLMAVVVTCTAQMVRPFQRLCDKIKTEKYFVGLALVNYTNADSNSQTI